MVALLIKYEKEYARIHRTQTRSVKTVRQQFYFSIVTPPAIFGAPRICEAVSTCQGIFSE
jgi:hypothetical protein